MTGSDALSPEEIAKVSFENKRRGYDPAAVDAHLKVAAATVTGLQDEVGILGAKVDALTVQVDAAKQAAKDAAQSPLELSDDELVDRIGVEAARLLADARVAAEERIAEADADARQIRAQAEKLYAERSEEADGEAQRIRTKALEEANARTLEAETSAEMILTSAHADIEVARSENGFDRESIDAEAAAIIREAEVARRQILGDLLRRRGAAKRQIEQLRAGRERLLQSHETVRRALDEVTAELSISMSEARAAANAAGHSITDGSIEELEAELEAARMVGLLNTGDVPVVCSPALPTSTSANTAGVEDANETAEAPAADAASDEAVETPDAEVQAEVHAEEVAVEDGEKTTVESLDQGTGDGNSDNVVVLDSARADVDTGSHPANRRSTNGQKAASMNDESGENENSVDRLFASLRDSNEAPAPKKSTGKKAPSGGAASKKKAARSKVTMLDTAAAASVGSEAVESAVDSVALSRRLKRVLADEQSRVMSTIKHAEVMPDLEGVLFSMADHRSGYWNEVLDQLDDPERASSGAHKAIDELVETIRRRVGGSLDDADGDADTALTSLRSIYRGIKTQLISETAEAVSESMLVTS